MSLNMPDFSRGYRYGSIIGFLAALAIALLLTVINNLRLEQKIFEKNQWIRELQDCKTSADRRVK